VPNAILDGGKHLWIDVTELSQASLLLRQNDAEILTWSILGPFRRGAWDIELKYAVSTTQEDLHNLTTKVCQLLGF